MDDLEELTGADVDDLGRPLLPSYQQDHYTSVMHCRRTAMAAELNATPGSIRCTENCEKGHQ